MIPDKEINNPKIFLLFLNVHSVPDHLLFSETEINSTIKNVIRHTKTLSGYLTHYFNAKNYVSKYA